MSDRKFNAPSPRIMSAVLASVLFTGMPSAMWAQTPQAQHSKPQVTNEQGLADQLQQIRRQVDQLQETIRQQGTLRALGGASAAPQPPATQTRSMRSMPGGMMGEMNAMPKGSMGRMSMDDKSRMGGMSMPETMDDMRQTDRMKDPGCCMSGMAAMGSMKASPSMAPPSALPGFPGASHLYHVGSTGFFLDHSDHLALTTDQRTRLNQMKEKAWLDEATAQRNIDEAEQRLFSLTGADQPDSARIEAEIKTIENLRSQQRFTYIRQVGEAAQVLTHAQREMLLGKQ